MPSPSTKWSLFHCSQWPVGHRLCEVCSHGECLWWRSSILAAILPLLCTDIHSHMGLLNGWILGQRGSSKATHLGGFWCRSRKQWSKEDLGKELAKRWMNCPGSDSSLWKYLLSYWRLAFWMLYKILIPCSLIILQHESKQWNIMQLASKWTVDPNENASQVYPERCSEESDLLCRGFYLRIEKCAKKF